MSVTRYMSFVWRVIILQPGARVQTAPALKRNQRDTQSRLERAPTNTVQFMSSLCPTKRDTNEIKQADRHGQDGKRHRLDCVLFHTMRLSQIHWVWARLNYDLNHHLEDRYESYSASNLCSSCKKRTKGRCSKSVYPSQLVGRHTWSKWKLWLASECRYGLRKYIVVE